FEAAPFAIRQRKLGTARAGNDIYHFLEEMTLRRGRFAGRQLAQDHVAEIAPTIEMQRHGARPEARPVRRLDCIAIDRQPFDDAQSLALEPVLVRIDAVAGLVERCHFYYSALTSSGITCSPNSVTDLMLSASDMSPK